MSNEVLIKNGNRAEWGADSAPIEPERLPEGYPWKEQNVIEFDVDGSVDYTVSDGITKISNQVPDDLIGCALKAVISVGDETISADGYLFTARTISAGFTAYGFKQNDGTVMDAPLIYVITDESTSGYESGTYILTVGGTAVGTLIAGETTHPISSDFLPIATPTTAGAMKQAAAVANVTAAPTAEEFNALLKSLRDAGILATS